MIPCPFHPGVVLSGAAEQASEELLALLVGELRGLVHACRDREGRRCDLTVPPRFRAVLRVVEQWVVVTAAEREVGECVGAGHLVPRLVALIDRDADLRLGPFDILVGDPPLDGCRVGVGFLGGGHRYPPRTSASPRRRH